MSNTAKRLYRLTDRLTWLIIGGFLIFLVIYIALSRSDDRWEHIRDRRLIASTYRNEIYFRRKISNLLGLDIDLDEVSHIDSTSVDQAMLSGADWLLGMQEAGGRFNYWYDPVSGHYSAPDDDNFLRQAGTAYSLALVSEVSGDIRYLDAAKKNLLHLNRFLVNLDEERSYYLFNGTAKLGGIGLPMLLMLKIRQLEGTKENDETLKRLAGMIFFLQDAYGTGQFKSTYIYHGDMQHEKASGWESRIYPGEAMYALAGMYREFNDESCRKSLDRAMDFYYSNEWTEAAFIPWTLQAMGSMYRTTSNSRYSDYALYLADHMLTEQNIWCPEDIFGSFHNIPSGNTGCYIEGIADAADIAAACGNTDKAETYRLSSLAAYSFLLRLQATPENSLGFVNPALAHGGFRQSYMNQNLRIDNTQHIISSMAKGLKFFLDTPALE